VYSGGELARVAATGDRQAFAAIYDRHADRLHDFCVGMLRNRDAAASSAPPENPPTTTAVVPTPDNQGSLPASPPPIVISPAVASNKVAARSKVAANTSIRGAAQIAQVTAKPHPPCARFSKGVQARPRRTANT